VVYGKWLVQASKQASSKHTHTHTHGCNEVTLGWGSLRLAPNILLSHPHSHTHIPVLSVIYWQDMKVTGAILVVFPVVLFVLTRSTFIHTIVLLLLSLYGLFSGYIIVRISIDCFYMKEVKNPLR